MRKTAKNLAATISIAAILFAAVFSANGYCLYTYAAEAPEAVGELGIQVTSSPMVKLTWDKLDCDGYKVYRDSTAIARVEAETANDWVTFVDEGIEPGGSYTYSVKAYNTEGGSEVYGASSPAVKVVDGYIYEPAEDGGIKLTGYTGREERLIIPDTVDGKTVTEIGEGCFAGNTWLGRVTVPEGVVKIDDYGFECCNLMQKVYLPDSLRTIGNGAFSGCGNLALVDMGSGVTAIGDGAFMACIKLRQIVLPAQLKTMGKFAFALCAQLGDVVFSGEGLEVIQDRAFYQCTRLTEMYLPDSVATIEKRAFMGCTALRMINGDYLEKIGDYAFERTQVFDLSASLDDYVTLGFGVFADNEVNKYYTDFYRDNVQYTDIPGTAELTEGVFYGSPIKGIRSNDPEEDAKFTVVDGSVYADDGKTLFAYFPMALNEEYAFEKTEEAEQKVFHVPEGVTRIAPYAFFMCELEHIYLPSTLTEVSDYAFTRSGISPDHGILTDYEGNTITTDAEGITFGEAAFENWTLGRNSALGAANGSKNSENDSENKPFPDMYTMTSIAGDKSQYHAEDFDGFTDISENFVEWSKNYIKANEEFLPMKRGIMTYLNLYKGNEHFHQMGSILNGDEDWTREAYSWGGHEYEEMYRMVDHGLIVELNRAKIFGEDLILYSGVTDSCVRRIAGLRPEEEITEESMINAIGTVYEEKAMMSTAAYFDVSYGFMGRSGVMLFILASKDAMNELGTFCIDSFSAAQLDGIGNCGEYEILFNPGSRFKVLDVGTAERVIYGSPRKCTYIIMELLGGEKDSSEPLDEYNGWKLVDGKWYYYSDGVMQTGWKLVDGKWYYLGSDGVMQTGWQKVDGKWYYLSASGAMVTGWQKVDGKWYYMSSSGAMQTGWQKVGGKWYYMSSSGAMQTGWQQIGGSWYYLNSDGSMAASTWIGKYYVGADGKWVK